MEPVIDPELQMENPMKPGDYHFPQALKLLFDGKKMSARFMPDYVYIELVTPEKGDAMTSPYFAAVTLDSEMRVVARFPWEPGHRALFADSWYVSKYDASKQ